MCNQDMKTDYSKHLSKESKLRQGVENKNNMVVQEQKAVTENSLANNTSSEVLLQSLRVLVKSNCRTRMARALIDTGSQKSYILKGLAQEMKYEVLRTEKIKHSLFGGVESNVTKHNCYRIRLANPKGQYSCNFEVLDQPKICNAIPTAGIGTWMKELKQLNIDITDTISDDVEILIGADVAGKLLTGEIISLDCGLVAVETYLGWTLIGRTPHNEDSHSNSLISATTMLVRDKTITNLWELDVIGIEDPIQSKETDDRQAVKDYFLKSVKINSEGRYEVQLPWFEGHPPLPTNINIAKRRLENTVNKLKKENNFEKYDEVLAEWEKEQVIEEIPLSEGYESNGHYLPHRPVYKENSTTKVRPVFDASSREYNQPSLNDCLSKGINLIKEIPALFINFRKNEIGVVSDIKKAFLQISLCNSDRDFVRFLWCDQEGNIKIYRHSRVVFGVTCSPFLLAAVLDYHLQSELNSSSSQYSKTVVEQLMSSFYVDNCITSVSSQEYLHKFISESTSVLSDAKFELRGWEFTDKYEQPNIPPTPVLGMLWDRKTDEIKLNIENVTNIDLKVVSKRKMLSIAHKLFDVIGMTCPTALYPKILLQQTWSLKLKWDEAVPQDIRDKFLRWVGELCYLAEIRIPRWFTGDKSQWSLHVFCDASTLAYATVIFLRVEMGNIAHVHFVEAKCRVAPTKKLSVPRLELMAATIGARLASNVIKSLNISDVKTHYWSDSSTVLSWIQRENIWKTFVWNRVQEIRKLSPKEAWKHVPGQKNPADLASRGCLPRDLCKVKWWEGPEWLRYPSTDWPSGELVYDEEEITKEQGRGIASLIAIETKDSDWYYAYFSKYEKILRMIGWIHRFKNNCCKNDKKMNGPLTVKELEKAEISVIKLIQKESFTGVNDLKLKTLYPFEDENGVLRLNTKLTQREDHNYFRQPAVLPNKHPVVRLLIQEQHVKCSHVGVQGLLSTLREKFWVLNGRRCVRSVIKKCPTCQRYKSNNLETSPAPLPEQRVRDAVTFEVVGLDFAGPLFIREGAKAWVCLFTCAVYRAVHLELVKGLTTHDFIQALRRFIARRGRPSTIHSDNGTNFTGTNNALKRIDWVKISEYATAQRIEWIFNPPSGGWWERLVGLVKQLLRKTLGNASLYYDELYTVLCDCESILNSRPLTYISEDSGDLIPLTPAMYLTDIKEFGVPDLDKLDSSGYQRRHQYRQKLREDLRKRFRNEYLGQLVLKSKKTTRPLEIGEIVIVQTEDKRRLNWPLAVVEELIPGKDGVCRLARLRTKTGLILRPIQRIYPLEVRSSKIVSEDKLEDTCEESKDEKYKPHVSGQEKIQLKTRSGRTVKPPSKWLE